MVQAVTITRGVTGADMIPPRHVGYRHWEETWFPAWQTRLDPSKNAVPSCNFHFPRGMYRLALGRLDFTRSKDELPPEQDVIASAASKISIVADMTPLW